MGQDVDAFVGTLREKAAQCRRLANGIINRDDPAVAALRRLAEDMERRAAAEEAALAPGLAELPSLRNVRPLARP